MGEVFLGRSAAGRLVAVKTIKLELTEEADFRERFAREVAAARRVSGAFTAAVIAADPDAPRPWLATVYVPAPALSSVVQECGPLPVAAVRWLGAGCAEALESIHAAGLVHRDLKPSNVLVSLDGPRVIDFGLARAAGRMQLTAVNSAVGTPAYMAPEQARDSRQATLASDVYSLGATMLFAATGHGPYRGDTVMEVLTRLAIERPDLRDLPGALVGIVMACLSRDPRERPTSTAVLAQLAREIGASADASELGPKVLPWSVVDLITEYRRAPRPADQPAVDAADETFDSQPAPGLVAGPVGRSHALPGRLASRWANAGRAGRFGSAGSGAPFWPRLRRALGSAVKLMALTAVGTVIGSYLVYGPSGPTSSLGSNASLSPSQSTRPSTRPQFQGGFFPSPGTGGRPPAPPPGAPIPHIKITRKFNGHYTVFTVRGWQWRPGLVVAVTLLDVGTAPQRPIVDPAGNFSFVLNGAGCFFHGKLTLTGTYQVVVSGPGGARAFAVLRVRHA